jgi:hypothetical protein
MGLGRDLDEFDTCRGFLGLELGSTNDFNFLMLFWRLLFRRAIFSLVFLCLLLAI